MPTEQNASERCPECGSLVREKARQCDVCGRALPMKMSLPTAALESAVVVLLVLVVAVGLLWMRQSGRGPWSSGSDELPALLAEAPTDMPTSTPRATNTPTRPPNTARPATATPMPETVTHVVASGDTLYGIAGQYGVDPDDVIALNDLERPDALSIGQQLLIPMLLPPRDEESSDEETAADSRGSGEEDGAGSDDERAAQSAAPTGEPIVLQEAEAYSVQSGDTLLGIAQAHDLTLEELLALNADRLEGPGASLQIGDSVVVVAAQVVTATPAPRAATLMAPVGDNVGDTPAEPDLPEDEALFPPPVALAPTGGTVVAGDAPLLRWSSVGVLPSGAFYVVSVRDPGDPDAGMWTEWISGYATAVRVPSRLRPALGSTRDVEWSVSVRQRGDGDEAEQESTAVGLASPWQAFTWSPGEEEAGDAGEATTNGTP